MLLHPVERHWWEANTAQSGGRHASGYRVRSADFRSEATLKKANAQEQHILTNKHEKAPAR